MLITILVGATALLLGATLGWLVANRRALVAEARLAALDQDKFLAMAHRKLGNHDEARKAYDQAVRWLDQNREALANDKALAGELRRFRNEAEEVLQLKK